MIWLREHGPEMRIGELLHQDFGDVNVPIDYGQKEWVPFFKLVDALIKESNETGRTLYSANVFNFALCLLNFTEITMLHSVKH